MITPLFTPSGRPIGAILVGEIKGRSQLSLLFSGQELDFEILRPRAVERRFGREELEKLQSRFLRSQDRQRTVDWHAATNSAVRGGLCSHRRLNHDECTCHGNRPSDSIAFGSRHGLPRPLFAAGGLAADSTQ